MKNFHLETAFKIAGEKDTKQGNTGTGKKVIFLS